MILPVTAVSFDAGAHLHKISSAVCDPKGLPRQADR
jgi:hypothetical protein